MNLLLLPLLFLCSSVTRQSAGCVAVTADPTEITASCTETPASPRPRYMQSTEDAVWVRHNSLLNVLSTSPPLQGNAFIHFHLVIRNILFLKAYRLSLYTSNRNSQISISAISSFDSFKSHVSNCKWTYYIDLNINSTRTDRSHILEKWKWNWTDLPSEPDYAVTCFLPAFVLLTCDCGSCVSLCRETNKDRREPQ